MDAIVEELYLLGLWEENVKTQKVEFTSQFSKAIRGLLDLYHNTYNEKNALQESFARQSVEILNLKEANHRLKMDCSKQATLISSLKFKEENLIKKIETSFQEKGQLRKKGLEERLKWQRRSQLERVALQKSRQEVSSLKDELRKIIHTASSKTKKNGDSLVEGRNIQILNNHIRVNCEMHEKKDSLKEEMLLKSLRRIDASQRVLVEESASICSSLQAINSSIWQATNALKVYVLKGERQVLDDSLKPKVEGDGDKNGTPTWLPLLVTNTHQICAELNDVVSALIKMPSHTTAGVSGEAVRKYINSFCSYENILDSAVESICLK